jgi:hypothetical protein
MPATETIIPHDGLTETSRVHPTARAWAGPLILFLIVTAFFWKLLLTNQYSWLESPDLANQVLPWFQYEAQQFHQHRLPIWDPFLLGGQSLIGQDQPGLAYPLNWLLFSVLLHNGRISYSILNWYYMLIHYFAALFCYLLCRDLGRSTIASTLGGVSFGLGGYIGTTDWPQMINAAIWAPLVFLFLFRAARGVRPLASAAFSGLFLGLSWLGGHHQIPIFLSLAAGGVWVYFLFEHGRFQSSRLAPMAAFLAFLLCTGALQMWPAFSYGRTAVRWVGSEHDPIRWDQPVPYNVHERYSLSPVRVLGLIIPGYMDFVSPYVGVVALSLAALALVCWWKTKEIRILCGVGLAGLFLAMAKNDVFHGILYSIVPLVEKARTPAAAIYLFHFAIAVLAAFGLDSLFQSSFRPLLRRLIIILLAFGALTFSIMFAILLGKAMAWPGDDRTMMSVLAAFALAALIYRASRNESRRAGLSILIVALYLVELGNVTLYALPHKDDKNRSIFLQHYGETRQVAEFLGRQPAPLRVWVNGDDVPFNFGDWYGIDTVLGYTASIPFNVFQLELHTARTRMLYGAAYTISKKPLFEGQQEVFRDDKGLAVFKSASVLPRVWTVHEAVEVKDPEDARRHLQDSSFDLQKKTFVYSTAPRLEQCDNDTVRSFSRGIDGATAVVDMKCRGMVVMSENNAPGWNATVDGKAVPIYDAYTALRGIVAGAGTHKIETRYRPLSVSAGAAATLAAFLGALVLCLAPKLRRNRRQSQAT